MFLDENEFDDDFDQTQRNSKYRSIENQPTTNKYSNRNNSYQDDDDEELPAFRGGSNDNNGSNSRARMLAQQREIQLKKRQASLSGGMVRSSLESITSSSPLNKSMDRQFTPAVRQFSAPKAALRDPSHDASSPEHNNEFQRPRNSLHASNTSRRFSQNKRYSDDEDDENDRRMSGLNRRSTERTSAASTSEWMNKNNNNTTDKHHSKSNRYNNNMYEDDNEMQQDDYKNNRKNHKNNDYKSSSNNNNNNKSSRNTKYNNYDDSDMIKKSSKWNDVSGGRDLQKKNYEIEEDVSNRPFGSESVQMSNIYSSSSNNLSNPKHHIMIDNPIPPSIPVIVPPNLTDMRSFLTSPLPKNCGVVQCYIRRNKSGTNKLYPIYSLYLKEGDVFLLASKKKPKNKTSNYLISMDQNDLQKTGRGYLGKLRSNFVGTEFQIFDNGINPKDTEPDEASYGSSSIRCELGSVMYAANVLGSRGPRKMQVALPGLDDSERIIQWKDHGVGDASGDNDHSILTRMKDRNLKDLFYLINKPPRWNEQVGAYVLNFNGRVTMASVKNFQLVDPDEQNAVVLQFGRVGKDDFTMDLQYPISPFQAFAVTLSSFDSKIACD